MSQPVAIEYLRASRRRRRARLGAVLAWSAAAGLVSLLAWWPA